MRPDELEINLDFERMWHYILLTLGIIISSFSIGYLTRPEFGWLTFAGCLISWATGRLFRK